ncbi:cytidine deaminase 1-like [Syzygium oleosum]|uniref:cytidine deaminase 1-like n=1 Tax=Syzygium oleosum TaxID=219896 RepID=UPI0011D1E26F|nr:cytidine deaminase 1-like [Syzygium oleosum]
MDPPPRFVIEACEAAAMAKDAGLALTDLLPTLVGAAKPLARTPISRYHVGAVGLGPSGRIFLGVNLEFPGLPLHHSVHAEQFLATNLALHRERRLLAFAVSSTPCGHCRQFFQEIRDAPDIQIRVFPVDDPDQAPDPAFGPLSRLLPRRFGPDDLLDKEVPLLLEPHHNGLTFLTRSPNPDRGSSCNGFCDGPEADELAAAALEAANESHAPYSKCPSGVAIVDREGKVYKGSYAESAAYNPSLGPVQAALVAYVAGGGGGYDGIVGAVLVEKEGAVVRQENTARLLMGLVSPKCDFRVVHCRSG